MIKRLAGKNYSPGRPIKSDQLSPFASLVITDDMGRRGAIATANYLGLPTTGVVTSPPAIDSTPPVAVNTATTNTGPFDAGDITPVLVEITYTDDTAIMMASIAAGNVTAMLGGVVMTVSLQSSNVVSASEVVATYAILPADGIWNTADNGTIIWTYGASAITDTSGNAALSISGVSPVEVYAEFAQLTTTASGTQTASVEIASTDTYLIDWGDGTTAAGTGNDSHQYSDGATSHQIVLRSKRLDLVTNIEAPSSRLSAATVSKDLVQMSLLALNNNQLTTFDSRPEWTALQQLWLHNNDITVFDSRPEWTSLQQLYVANNKLTTFDSRPEWTALRNLWVYSNQLTTFDSRPEWTALRQLYVSGNQLTTFDSRPEWTALQQLWVHANDITVFDSRPEWTALRTLYVANNQLTTFDSRPEWTALQQLRLNDNPLTAFDALIQWASFRELRLSSTSIADLNPLYVTIANPAFAVASKTIDTATNPGSAGVLSANITNATANGWNVTN